MYCWSPNDAALLGDRQFMITRQILRLIVYYLMPLAFVSVFYILIAKHLFQAKSVIFTPAPARPFLNDVTANKRRRLNYSSGESHTANGTSSKLWSLRMLSLRSNDPEQQSSDVNSSSQRKNPPVRSITLDNEQLMDLQDSAMSSSAQAIRSTESSSNNLRRSQDLLHQNSIANKKNRVTMHTLYQDAKTRKQLRARRKVAKTVLFLCIVFFICWLPKQIHDLYW